MTRILSLVAAWEHPLCCRAGGGSSGPGRFRGGQLLVVGAGHLLLPQRGLTGGVGDGAGGGKGGGRGEVTLNLKIM